MKSPEEMSDDELLEALEPIKHKFSLGSVVATPGVLEVVHHPLGVWLFLDRHASGDWGSVDPEDAKQNDAAVANNDHADNPNYRGRVMSVYKYFEFTIWVITEWDRSVTTVLLPSEY